MFGWLEKRKSSTSTCDARLASWFIKMEVPGWPVQEYGDRDLHFLLQVHEGWVGERRQQNIEVSDVFFGDSPAECLTVSFMPEADPNSDMENWIGFFLAATGTPMPEMLERNNTIKMLSWREFPNCADVKRRLVVDECRCFEGMAALTDVPCLARFYVILARRGKCAWKVCLSFESACPPSSLDSDVAKNDHVRAAATFGDLKLL
jgi:hypothetical protein